MLEINPLRDHASTFLRDEDPHANELSGVSMLQITRSLDRQATRDNAPKRFERQWVSLNMAALNDLLSSAPNDCHRGIYNRVMELLVERDAFVGKQLELLEGGAA